MEMKTAAGEGGTVRRGKDEKNKQKKQPGCWERPPRSEGCAPKVASKRIAAFQVYESDVGRHLSRRSQTVASVFAWAAHRHISWSAVFLLRGSFLWGSACAASDGSQARPRKTGNDADVRAEAAAGFP